MLPGFDEVSNRVRRFVHPRWDGDVARSECPNGRAAASAKRSNARCPFRNKVVSRGRFVRADGDDRRRKILLLAAANSVSNRYSQFHLRYGACRPCNGRHRTVWQASVQFGMTGRPRVSSADLLGRRHGTAGGVHRVPLRVILVARRVSSTCLAARAGSRAVAAGRPTNDG
jgi:hypothetical protein